MRAEVVERRQAVVSRLVALRADGRLQSQVVRAAAESLGVTERTVWRWLAAGSYEPRWRIGWRTTEEAVEAFYRTGGRPTAAWRLLRDEGVEVPQLSRFDGGKECLAHAVKRAAGELGCAALPTAPYSPHLKGKVERLHRTIGDGLIATAAALHWRAAAGERKAVCAAEAADA